MSGTVYINDNPIGETEVYHARRGHVSTIRDFRDRYVRETTASEAQSEGLRPCKHCFPDQAMDSCPGCGHQGDGDDVLAGDQQWCPNRDCRVVSFTQGGT